MKPYLILILVFMLAVLQGAFLKLNLVLLLVLTWTTFRPVKEAFLVAFLSGLLLDLAKGMPLGLSSLIFLVIVFILSLYSRRFDSLHPIFLPVFVFFSSLVYSFIFYHYWFWLESLILALLALGARYLLVFLVGRIDRQQLRLQ
ncbi:rod shape-determining protein MreD [Microgenomates group bacterium RBG_19FT_COMBO_39_10]|nr:MAG: rod shape-determining protein MreD [Microgenomates group bacterium RBG_19FT_COMBO_39_10]